MKIYKIIFSPTGGTKKVADILCDGLGADEIATVDLSENGFVGCSIPEDSVAVIAVPSFGGRAPEIAIERLKSVKASGAKAIVVAVYGNREQEDTLIETADCAKECGFEVIAGVCAVAEHSIAHQYATGRPDKDDEKKLRSFAEQIKSRSPEGGEVKLPGNRPYKKAGSGLVPKASSACVGCVMCAQKCPVGAIDKTDPRKTDKNACIGCMRCVSICPKNARAVSPIMVAAVGVALKKACSERKDNVLYI